MPEAPEAELQNVSKHFGEVSAVDSVSLSVQRGEFLTLLGPSGCGKTTLLRMLAGFESPDAGRVFLGGVDVTDVPPYRRDVTTVFQHYALFPHMNVFGNVAFGLERRRLSREEIVSRVTRTLELVRMSDLDRRQPSELSGGQKQRVALARALVLEPKVLLLDEPLAALDLKLRKEMQVELKGLQRRLGISFIYVTHDQEEALTMSDRIVVMNAGHIEQIGRAEEIYERPRTEFVAGFIGVSNIIEGIIEGIVEGGSVEGGIVESGIVEGIDETEGYSLVSIAGANIRVMTDDHQKGSRVRVLVRPEKISISKNHGPSALRGKIESAVYLGESTQWRISLDDGQWITVLEQNREPFRQNEDRIGQTVFLTWEPQSVVILKT